MENETVRREENRTPDPLVHCWIEVDLDNIQHNYQTVREFLHPDVKMMAIVKADAYGHGAYAIASQLEEHGVDYVGVALAEEAVALRRNGIEKPILVLSPVLKEWLPMFIEYGITPNIVDFVTAELYSELAAEQGVSAPIHIEIDSGMGRYGLNPAEAEGIVERISALSNINIEGLFTHFAAAGNPQFSRGQLEIFNGIVHRITGKLSIPFVHCANSIGVMLYPNAHYSMVRVGSLLYGQDLSGSKQINLLPTWSMKSKIHQIRYLPRGANVGYGDDVRLRKDTVLGIVPVGFTDGLLTRTIERPYSLREAFKLALRNFAFYSGAEKVQEYLGYRGNKVPVVGRVGMQHVCIDLSGHDHPQIGEVVTMNARKASINPTIPKYYQWKGQWFKGSDPTTSTRLRKLELNQQPQPESKEAAD